jgi:hypothetical protein
MIQAGKPLDVISHTILAQVVACWRACVGSPIPIASSPNCKYVRFRWQLDKWQQGLFKQIHFTFNDCSKYTLRNHQPPESSNLELTLRPAIHLTAEEIWYIEAIVHHAFDLGAAGQDDRKRKAQDCQKGARGEISGRPRLADFGPTNMMDFPWFRSLTSGRDSH